MVNKNFVFIIIMVLNIPTKNSLAEKESNILLSLFDFGNTMENMVYNINNKKWV